MPTLWGRSLGDYIGLLTVLVVVVIFGRATYGMIGWGLNPKAVGVEDVINMFFQPMKYLSYIGYVLAVAYSVKDVVRSMRTHIRLGHKLIYLMFILGSLYLLYLEYDSILGYSPITSPQQYEHQTVRGYDIVPLKLNPPSTLYILFTFIGYLALLLVAYEYFKKGPHQKQKVPLTIQKPGHGRLGKK